MAPLTRPLCLEGATMGPSRVKSGRGEGTTLELSEDGTANKLPARYLEDDVCNLLREEDDVRGELGKEEVSGRL